MVRSISANTPEKRNNVFARVNLKQNEANKVTVFIWGKYDLFGVYKTDSTDTEIYEITPSSPHNVRNVIAEYWDEGSSFTDRYKVCINKDLKNCIPINYYVNDPSLIR